MVATLIIKSLTLQRGEMNQGSLHLDTFVVLLVEMRRKEKTKQTNVFLLNQINV